MIQKVVNETLTSSGAGATAITLNTGQDCEDYAIQARDSVDMKISNLEALTTFWTVKADSAMSLNEVLGPGAALFWAESGSTESVVEVIPLRRYKTR